MIKRFRFLTLAALVLLPLAACDEGTDTVAPIAGSITGTVTVDAVGAAGVTVTLSSGETAITTATGQFTFSNIPAGSYSITISGQSPTAAFLSLGETTTITTAGQVATVNFAGSLIRTSAIIGSVTSSVGGLEGVTVVMGSPETRTLITDVDGQFSAVGLLSGTYHVTITGVPDGMTCGATTQNVTVAPGESKVAAFACVEDATASISGVLYIDENNKNDLYDGSNLEDLVNSANVAITLEGPSIGVKVTTQTDATGAFSFPELVAGSYNVTIDDTDPDLPGDVAYGLASTTILMTLTSGASGTANFPFDITTQEIKVYAFLGRDASPAPAGISTSIGTGVAPTAGVVISLHPTEADAVGLDNALGTDTTDANGEATFSFLRTADTSPAGAVQDQIVFAVYRSSPTVDHVPNGETRLEISYNTRNRSDMAGDTFDLLNTRVVMKAGAVGVGTSTGLVGWNSALWLNDSLNTASQTGVTNASGEILYNDAVAATSLPDTFFTRLSATQAAAGGTTFTSTPVAARGTVAGSQLRFIHDGTVARTDTVDVGDHEVKFDVADIQIRVFHEADDSTGAPMWTGGDNIENTDNIDVDVSWGDSTRTLTAQAIDGVAVFLSVPTDVGPYTFNARSTSVNQVVLNDTSLTQTAADISMQGSTGQTLYCPLGSNTPHPPTGCATFGFKYNNGTLNGTALAADATAAEDLIVTMTPAAGNIQGSAMMTDTTDAGGAFGWTGLMEGPYTVSLTGDASWGVVTADISVDLQGNGDVDIANFIVRRLDTSIKGVVVNDRDGDGNVIDPNEGLAGVVINAYADGSGAATIDADSLMGTATTDANGAYTISGLPENTYTIQAVQPGTGEDVFRAISAAGVLTDTAVVMTAATVTGLGNNNTRTVGSTLPTPLPAFAPGTNTVSFDGRTNFTFVTNDNVANGVITNAGAPVGSAAVVLTRCQTSAGFTATPVAGTCTTATSTTPITANTDAAGAYSFAGLQEGVYQVVPAAASTPAGLLFWLSGPTDIDKGDFTQP